MKLQLVRVPISERNNGRLKKEAFQNGMESVTRMSVRATSDEHYTVVQGF